MSKAKGDCFKAAFDFVMNNPDTTLVHGIAIGTGGEAKGIRMSHAWCEVGGIVIDVSNGQTCVTRTEHYYSVGTISEVRKYSRERASVMALKHGHYGPWEDV